MIQEAYTPEQIERCFSTLLELRPHLKLEQFVDRIQTQRSQGYRLAYIEADAQVQSAMGFRIENFLAWGKILYIDGLNPPSDTRGRYIIFKTYHENIYTVFLLIEQSQSQTNHLIEQPIECF